MSLSTRQLICEYLPAGLGSMQYAGYNEVIINNNVEFLLQVCIWVILPQLR